MLTVHLIRHLATLSGRIDSEAPLVPGETCVQAAARLMPHEWRAPTNPARLHGVLNGMPLEGATWNTPLRDGDDLLISPIPQGWVGPAAAATAATTAATTSIWSSIVSLFISSLAATAISTAISFLLSKRMPKQQRGDETSAQYSWDGEHQQFGVGAPIAQGFGTEKVAGQVVQFFRRGGVANGSALSQPVIGNDRLFLLLSFGDGPIDSVAGVTSAEFQDLQPSSFSTGLIKVNDNELTQALYPEARFSGRLGYEQQSAIDGFHNTKTEYSVGGSFEQQFDPASSTLSVAAHAGTGSDSRVVVPVDGTGFSTNDQVIIDPGGPSQAEYTIAAVRQTGTTITHTYQSTTPGPPDVIHLDSTSGLTAGDFLVINPGGASTGEVFGVLNVLNGTDIQIDPPTLRFAHSTGELVQRRLVLDVGFVQRNHPAAVQIRKTGPSLLKSVTYTTVAGGTQFSRDSADAALGIRIQFEALFHTSQLGGINAHRVDFRVSDRQRGATAWSAGRTYSVIEKQRGSFAVTLNYQLTSSTATSLQPVEVMIERLTAIDDEFSFSRCTVESIVETLQTTDPTTGVPDRFRYPFLSLFGLNFPATQTLNGRLPRFSAVCRLKRVVNFDDAGLISSLDDISTWTYSANPLRVAIHILLDQRCGMGDVFSEDAIDWESWDAGKRYSDQMVDDGAGGTRKRFEFHYVFDAQRPRWEQVLHVCSMARAVPIPIGGKLILKFEHPDDPANDLARPISQLFCMASVVPGSFSMEWLPVTERPTVLNFQIRNAARDYEPDVISVEDPRMVGLNDPTLLNARGFRGETVQYLGCTSASQARAEGIYRHAVAREVKRRIRFQIPNEALGSLPGDRFRFQHPAVQWYGHGPVKTTIILDAASGQPTITVADARWFEAGDSVHIAPNTARAEFRTVLSVDVDASQITFTTNLSSAHLQADGDVVANLGLSTNTVVNADSAADQEILNVATLVGFQVGDEVWINPGGPREERAWVVGFTAGGLRLHKRLFYAHTAAQADLVRSLTYPTTTCRVSSTTTAVQVTTLVLDGEVLVPTSAGAVKLALRQHDGSIAEVGIVSPGAGTWPIGTVFTVDAGVTFHRGSPVVIGVESKMTREFIITSLSKGARDGVVQIEAVDWAPQVWADEPLTLTGDDSLVDEDQTALSPSAIPASSELTGVGVLAAISVSADGSSDGIGVDVGWRASDVAQRSPVRVFWRPKQTDGIEGPWTPAGESGSGTLRVAEIDQPGDYEVVAVPTSLDGGSPHPNTATPTTVTVYERGSRRPRGVGVVRGGAR